MSHLTLELLPLLLPGSSSGTAPQHCLQTLNLQIQHVLNALAGGLPATEVFHTCSTPGMCAGLPTFPSAAMASAAAMLVFDNTHLTHALLLWGGNQIHLTAVAASSSVLVL